MRWTRIDYSLQTATLFPDARRIRSRPTTKGAKSKTSMDSMLIVNVSLNPHLIIFVFCVDWSQKRDRRSKVGLLQGYKLTTLLIRYRQTSEPLSTTARLPRPHPPLAQLMKCCEIPPTAPQRQPVYRHPPPFQRVPRRLLHYNFVHQPTTPRPFDLAFPQTSGTKLCTSFFSARQPRFSSASFASL